MTPPGENLGSEDINTQVQDIQNSIDDILFKSKIAIALNNDFLVNAYVESTQDGKIIISLSITDKSFDEDTYEELYGDTQELEMVYDPMSHTIELPDTSNLIFYENEKDINKLLQEIKDSII